jgi:phosphoribosylglycinamide formyltransferase-1
MNSNIILFASGTGSNAIHIIEHGIFSKIYNTACIVCNNPKAKIIEYAHQNNIPLVLVTKAQFNHESFLDILEEYEPQLLVLAGFLWMIPAFIIHKYPMSIINIHPALLPKFGGAGMYGKHVHQAVKAAGEVESGITIHLVNEEYDKGKIILQKKVALLPTDDADAIAQKVLSLEHIWYKQVVAHFMTEMNR